MSLADDRTVEARLQPASKRVRAPSRTCRLSGSQLQPWDAVTHAVRVLIVGATVVVGGKPEPKQRLRVIFENGTESSMYRQSLSIRLHEAEGQAVVGTRLDEDEVFDADKESGHIYVLRSLSEDSQIASKQDLHKIGFSTTSVEQRIANATKDATYLMAPVRTVEDYRTYNLRPYALEHLLHRVFAEVRLDVTQIDAKGRSYDPSEWFIVPRRVINQAITMIMSGEIVDYVYDAKLTKLVPSAGSNLKDS